IPQYLDYFQTDTADNRFFYLVQEIVEGRSLAELLAAGDRFSEEQVKRIAMMVLQALTYLHGLTPPVIHRDIKPQNLILGTDGRIYMVDFGAVQLVHRATTAMGSTVVGTFGYMAPEQLQCRAVPATDLYSLGATLLHLLTRQNPSDLPQRRLKIDFRASTAVSDSFADWLDGLIEPVIEDRFASAEAAFMALQDPHFLRNAIHSNSHSLTIPKPSKTQVELRRSSQSLLVRVPIRKFSQITAFAFLLIPFIALGISFLGAILLDPLQPLPSRLTPPSLSARILMPLLNIVFPSSCFGFILWNSWISGGGDVTLSIEKDRFKFTRRMIGIKRSKKGYTENLQNVIWDTKKDPISIIDDEGNQIYKLGLHLSEAEKSWLFAEIKAFIADQQRDR
ncbi:MAG: serine/threonine-protein kinase, partial [Cyanobacteria bacterium P01_C01_bin.70]